MLVDEVVSSREGVSSLVFQETNVLGKIKISGSRKSSLSQEGLWGSGRARPAISPVRSEGKGPTRVGETTPQWGRGLRIYDYDYIMIIQHHLCTLPAPLTSPWGQPWVEIQLCVHRLGSQPLPCTPVRRCCLQALVLPKCLWGASGCFQGWVLCPQWQWADVTGAPVPGVSGGC